MDEKKMGGALRWILGNEAWLSKTKGVIQLGIGYKNAEFRYWVKRGFNQIYCEPVEKFYAEVSSQIKRYKKSKMEMRAFNVAISNFCGKSQFNVLHAVNMKGIFELPDSSTLLTLSDSRPDKFQKLMVKERLDVDLSNYNMLYMDIEGSEFNAIKGGLETMKHMDFVYAEVALVEIFTETTIYGDFVQMMGKIGFKVVHNQSLGRRYDRICHDVFFIRKAGVK